MSLYLIQGAVEEGLIYALVALGLFISYSILDIADLTTDGTFVLGAAVASMFVMAGHPFLSLPVAALAGMGAGLVTALLQTKMGVPPILAGIINMTALYTINLLVQGGVPNLFYPQSETLFTFANKIFGDTFGILIILLLILAVIVALMFLFFKTGLGLSIRATGDNIGMVQSSSINPAFTITVGLCIANGLTALSGALIAHKNTQGDINLGTGIVVIGLASLVIGSVFFRTNKILPKILGAVLGAIIYRIIFVIALRYTPDAGYLKIVSAAIVAIIIAYPHIKSKTSDSIRRRKEIKRRAETK